MRICHSITFFLLCCFYEAEEGSYRRAAGNELRRQAFFAYYDNSHVRLHSFMFSDTDASKIRFVREAVRSTKRFSKVQACDKGVEEAIKWIAERTPQEASFNAD